MCDIQWVEFVDVAVGMCRKVIEDVGLERV